MSSNNQLFVFDRVSVQENGVRVEDYEGSWDFTEASLASLWNIFSVQVLPYFDESWNVNATVEAFTLIQTLNPLNRSAEDLNSLRTAVSSFQVAFDRSINGIGPLPEPSMGALSHHLSRTGRDSGEIMVQASLEYALGNVVKHIFAEAYELNSYLLWVLRLQQSQDPHRQLLAPRAATAVATCAGALFRVIRSGKLMTVFGTPPDRTPNYHDYSWRDVAREVEAVVTNQLDGTFPHLLEVTNALNAAAILEGLVEHYGSRTGLNRELITLLLQNQWAPSLNAGFNIDTAAQMIGLE